MRVVHERAGIDLSAAERAVGSTTITSTPLGLLRQDPRSHGEFPALTRATV